MSITSTVKTLRFVSDSGQELYNFLEGRIGILSDIDFQDDRISLTLCGLSETQRQIDKVEAVLEQAVEYASDQHAADGVWFEFESGDSHPTRALIMGYTLNKVSSTALQDFGWGNYILILNLVPGGRAYEGVHEIEYSASSVSNGWQWDLTGDVETIGNLGNRICRLTIDGSASLDTIHLGIKPVREADAAFASTIYGLDFQDNRDADTTASGSGTTGYITTSFATDATHILRAKAYLSDWGTASGASSVTWRGQQGTYRPIFVYSYGDSSTLAAVQLKLQVGQDFSYDSGIIYPEGGDTTIHAIAIGPDLVIGHDRATYNNHTMTATIGMSYFASRISGSSSLALRRVFLVPKEHYISASVNSTNDIVIETTNTGVHTCYTASGTVYSTPGIVNEVNNWFYPRRGGKLVVVIKSADATTNLTAVMTTTHRMHNFS